MNAEMIVRCLLERDLIEATVRLPPRGTKWIAVYTGVEPGKQVWRSTGLRDRAAALALAKKWEAQARRTREASAGVTKKPTIRVRRGSGEAAAGLLTREEAAALLGISVRAVREIERRGLEKLRRALRRFWNEHSTGQVKTAADSHDLVPAEIDALFSLTRTPLERRALTKLLAAIRTDR